MGSKAQGLTAAAAVLRKRRGAAPFLQRAEPYALLAPTTLLVGAVLLFPIAELFYVSFQRTNYFELQGFAGLANYADLLGAGGLTSLIASAVFVIVSDMLAVAIGLALAIVLEAPLKGRGALRTLLIVPWLVSQVVAALLWQAMLDADFGPLPALLKAWFGIAAAPLANESSAMVALVLANVWHAYPFAFILFLAALQSIPSELYEAASLDGATRRQLTRYIVLPLMARTAAVVLILLTFQFFTAVTLPLILTGGGPNEATYVLALRIWREAFTYYNFGHSTATGVVVFALNLLLSGVYIRSFVLKEAKRV